MAINQPSVAVAVVEDDGATQSAVSWAAIVAGAFAAVAISLILMAVGAGFGLVSTSAWPGQGASAAAFGIGAGIWLIVVQWLASAFGGYLTGRLRRKWTGPRGDEVLFRDTAHGFLAWALGTVVVVGLLASALGATISGGAQAIGAVAGGSAQGAAQGVVQSGGTTGVPTDYFVDTLFRSDTASPATSPTAGPSDSQEMRAESARILGRVVTTGDIQPDDRTYLARLVAQRTGLAQPEAEKRVDDVVGQVKAAEAEVRQAAEEARKAGASLSFFTAFSWLVGAFIACAAAGLGGFARDE
jgi:hypothetical protein